MPSTLRVAALMACVSVAWSGQALAQEEASDGASAENAAETPATDEVTPAAGQTVDYVPLGIAGLATFGASWAATIVVAATTSSGDKKRAAGHAVVPIAGPFIMLMERSHAEDLEGVLGGLGALQGLGVAAALLGFTLESKVLETRSGAYLAPAITPGGVALSGAF